MYVSIWWRILCLSILHCKCVCLKGIYTRFVEVVRVCTWSIIVAYYQLVRIFREEYFLAACGFEPMTDETYSLFTSALTHWAIWFGEWIILYVIYYTTNLYLFDVYCIYCRIITTSTNTDMRYKMKILDQQISMCRMIQKLFGVDMLFTIQRLDGQLV